MVCDLLHTAPFASALECATAHCNKFARYFADKITRIPCDLGSGLTELSRIPGVVPRVSVDSTVMDFFHLKDIMT